MTVFISVNENKFPHKIHVCCVPVYLLFYEYLISISVVHNLLKNNELRTTNIYAVIYMNYISNLIYVHRIPHMH